MAAAIVATRRMNNVLGNRRSVTWDSVTFTSNLDTLVVPGLKRIEAIDFTPTTNVSYGFTISGATLTIQSGGTVAGLMQVSGI